MDIHELAIGLREHRDDIVIITSTVLAMNKIIGEIDKVVECIQDEKLMIFVEHTKNH